MCRIWRWPKTLTQKTAEVVARGRAKNTEGTLQNTYLSNNGAFCEVAGFFALGTGRVYSLSDRVVLVDGVLQHFQVGLFVLYRGRGSFMPRKNLYDPCVVFLFQKVGDNALPYLHRLYFLIFRSVLVDYFADAVRVDFFAILS